MTVWEMAAVANEGLASSQETKRDKSTVSKQSGLVLIGTGRDQLRRIRRKQMPLQDGRFVRHCSRMSSMRCAQSLSRLVAVLQWSMKRCDGISGNTIHAQQPNTAHRCLESCQQPSDSGHKT